LIANEARSDLFHHTYKNSTNEDTSNQEDTSEEEEDKVTKKAELSSQLGYYCPYCEYVHVDHTFELETWFGMDEDNYDSDVGEHIYSSLDHTEVQVVICQDTTWLVDEGNERPVPTMGDLWECTVCEELYGDKHEAEICCSWDKKHL